MLIGLTLGFLTGGEVLHFEVYILFLKQIYFHKLKNIQ